MVEAGLSREEVGKEGDGGVQAACGAEGCGAQDQNGDVAPNVEESDLTPTRLGLGLLVRVRFRGSG